MMFGLVSSASAANAIPGIDNIMQMFIDVASGKLAVFIIVIIMGFSFYNAWKNGNPSALIWGVFVSIGIAILAYFAQAVMDWGTANGTTVVGGSTTP